MTEKDYEILEKYVPETSLPILKKWFEQRKFQLKITKKRSTKLGDFRANFNDSFCRISVNHNLNKYAFLITLTHEFAHLLVWNKHKNKVNAHGIEWKTEFAKLMQVHLDKNVFPNDIQLVLINHLKNPPASSQADIYLSKILKKYDDNSEKVICLKDVPLGTVFSLENNRVFKKLEPKRTRVLCEEIHSKKKYLIHSMAEIVVINP